MTDRIINWVLQKNITKPEVLFRIQSSLNGVDEIFEEIEVVPFSMEVPVINNNDAFNIFYGSTTMMLNAYGDKKLREGVFFDPSTFLITNYVAQWGEHVLNSDGRLLKFGSLDELTSSTDKTWFIRPNDDRKEFGGKLMKYADLIVWKNQVCDLNLPNLNSETKVWISKPKNIRKEWRLFIVNDEIVSSSRYMWNGKLEESSSDNPKEMIEFASERIENYHLHDVYVMDIALTDEGYKLIECNCFNGTGFYHHNIPKVVKAVNGLVKKKLQKI